VHNTTEMLPFFLSFSNELNFESFFHNHQKFNFSELI